MLVETERSRRAHAVPALAAATVALQIGYPLVDGATRDVVTVATVLTFAAASVTHALVTRGPRIAAALLVIAGGLGLAAEWSGLRTGVPFGHYAYAATLGPRIAGVPAVVGLAWVMMAWPSALAARRLAASSAGRVAVGAWALASWDLFLDPQMVAAGHWSWTAPNPHLPGVATVPLTNLAGWLLVSLVISLLLQRVLGDHPPGDDLVMLALYLWTYASCVLALVAFLGLGAAALWGAAGMGVVAIPLASKLARRRARR